MKVDNAYLKERIRDDLEYNEFSGYDSSSNMSNHVLEGVVNVVQLEDKQDQLLVVMVQLEEVALIDKVVLVLVEEM